MLARLPAATAWRWTAWFIWRPSAAMIAASVRISGIGPLPRRAYATARLGVVQGGCPVGPSSDRRETGLKTQELRGRVVGWPSGGPGATAVRHASHVAAPTTSFDMSKM